MVAITFTLYVVVAVPLFEEPHLVELFGEKYTEYMKKTPMLIPFSFTRYSELLDKNK